MTRDPVIGKRGDWGRRIIIRNNREYHVTKGWRSPPPTFKESPSGTTIRTPQAPAQ